MSRARRDNLEPVIGQARGAQNGLRWAIQGSSHIRAPQFPTAAVGLHPRNDERADAHNR